MSAGRHNSAHAYQGRRGRSRGLRVASKLGRAITLSRLNALLAERRTPTMTERQPGDEGGSKPTDEKPDEKKDDEKAPESP